MNKESDQYIEFYFDPISPYVWLASTQLERIRDQTGHDIIFKPILFAGLLKAHGHKGPAEIPAKRDYTFRDVMRRASTYGLEIQGPPIHPFNPLLTLRICTAIDDNKTRAKFACSVLDAAWSKGNDITDSKVVSRLAQECDIDPDWALASAQDMGIKSKLMQATDAAIQLGMFGVPTFRIDDQLFWGDDRIDQLFQHVRGHTINEDRLATILKKSSN